MWNDIRAEITTATLHADEPSGIDGGCGKYCGHFFAE